MKMTNGVVSTLTCLLAGMCLAGGAEPCALIPAPVKMTAGKGAFTLKPDTQIIADGASAVTGKELAEFLRNVTGFELKVVTEPSASRAVKNAILLTTQRAKAGLGDEGYELNVTTDSVVIRAPVEAGLFYGAVTLCELFPPEIFSTHVLPNHLWQATSVKIEDQPRFKWRGMMLDVSRDFFTKKEVERLLDMLALHKINTFHWHLVDNDGWRIEIKRYPKLTQVGAWREHSRVTPTRYRANNSPSDAAHPAWSEALPTAYGPDGRYGGFYTQEDIREVVAYANMLHITIVPEIEMPGHSASAILAYPELACQGVGDANVFCAGQDASFDFMEGVLTEVFELFPSKYIHIGGDEVKMDYWTHCDKCQARMKSEGMTNVTQLQSYFIKRIEKFVNAHGRSLIGWSEIIKGGLAQNATVMDWKGGAVEGATTGHDVVMSPTAFCYLDYYQASNHINEPWAIGGYLPLSKVYAFEPIPTNLPPQFQSHILGAQGNLWTEYVASFEHIQYMTFPRMCALSEAAWSPKAARNWNDFSTRLQSHLRRLDELGIHYRPVTAETAGAKPIH